MDEAFSPEQLEQLKSLRPGLAVLEAMGADRFDPCRFRYIESMARRALDQRQAVAQLVDAKALKALRDYQHDFIQERERAAIIVDRITEKAIEKTTEQCPGSAGAIQELFECCDFRAVKRMDARLQVSTSEKRLKALRFQLEQEQSAPGASPQEVCFDEILRQQEDDLVTFFSDHAADPHAGRSDRPEYEKPGELKSVRHFRESLLKLNAEKLVAQAIEHAPENPGPLNPQMLVIHSLATMRDLSPHYMHRFVSYIDTLLWLEQASKESESAAATKTGAKPGRKR